MAEDRSRDKEARSELKESAQRIWLAGLGALAVAEEEGGKMFNTLVERGQEWESRGKERVDEVRSKARSTVRSRVGDRVDELEDLLDERISSAMERFGVPSRREIRDLSDRVEELTAKIEALHARRESGSAG